MSTKKTKEITTQASNEALAELNNLFPQAPQYQARVFPRIAFASQDKIEGEGKNKKISVYAGTFFKETPTEEKDENGYAIFDREEVGDSIELQVVYLRQKLSFYDNDAEATILSPEFDFSSNEDDEAKVPLFKQGKLFATGFPKDLRAMPKFNREVKKSDGSGTYTACDLLTLHILYVLYNGELHKLTIKGKTSNASFRKFRKDSAALPTMIINVTSEAQSKGDTEWNVMKFEKVRTITEEEAKETVVYIKDIKQGIEDQKAYYADNEQGDASAVEVVNDDDF